MAFWVPGKTLCGICGQVVQTDDDAVVYPSFVPPAHPLHRFSDGVFYRWCLEADADGQDVIELYRRYNQHLKARPPYSDKRAVQQWYDDWVAMAAQVGRGNGGS